QIQRGRVVSSLTDRSGGIRQTRPRNIELATRPWRDSSCGIQDCPPIVAQTMPGACPRDCSRQREFAPARCHPPGLDTRHRGPWGPYRSIASYRHCVRQEKKKEFFFFFFLFCFLVCCFFFFSVFVVRAYLTEQSVWSSGKLKAPIETCSFGLVVDPDANNDCICLGR